MTGKTLVAVFSASGVTKKVGEEIARHKNVKGDVKWEKGTQITRPDEAVIKKWRDEVL